MKKTNALWGSISILIGVVIAILSLLHGIWATVALITVFSAWGLWLIFTQLIPSWKSNRTYRRRARQSRKQREGLENFDSSVGPVLLRHVNHRISEHLQLSYPKAHWEWTMADPARFVVYGGTGRIPVCKMKCVRAMWYRPECRSPTVRSAGEPSMSVRCFTGWFARME